MLKLLYSQCGRLKMFTNINMKDENHIHMSVINQFKVLAPLCRTGTEIVHVSMSDYNSINNTC